MSKLVACYIRVSTKSQNLEGQQLEIERWLNGHGIDRSLVRWYVDKKSGDNLQRPAFEEMQKAIFLGEIGTMCVYKLDRLSRSLRDGINTLCDMVDKGVRVVSVSQQLDFGGTTGKLVASVLFAVAEMEQETRRERQSVGIEAAKKAGKYDFEGRGRKKGSTKAKPWRALKMREKGLTVPEIANALGVSRNTVFVYLRSEKAGEN